MKNLLWIAAAALGTAIGMSACSVDTDSDAEAQVPYIGICDSIVFEDSNDTVFAGCISSLLESKELGLSGDNSRFMETATSNDRYIENAIYKCNQQAIKNYDDRLKQMYGERFRAILDETYGDSISFEELNRFTCYYSLYAFINGYDIQIATYKYVY